jgi:hypothetical protein
MRSRCERDEILGRGEDVCLSCICMETILDCCDTVQHPRGQSSSLVTDDNTLDLSLGVFSAEMDWWFSLQSGLDTHTHII